MVAALSSASDFNVTLEFTLSLSVSFPMPFDSES